MNKAYMGSVLDISTMSERCDEHNNTPQSSAGEMDIPDVGTLSDIYPEQWRVLGDKGHQGASKFCKMIYPHKGTSTCVLTIGEDEFNQKYRLILYW